MLSTQAEQQALTSAAARRSELEAKLQRVLLLDAKPPRMQFLADLLRAITRPAIRKAATASQAMALAAEFHPQAIIVGDGEGVDGARFARELRSSAMPCRQAPVIMILTKPTAAAVVGARDAGVHEFLVPPYTLRDLTLKLEAALLSVRDWVEEPDYVGPDRRRFNSSKAVAVERRHSPRGCVLLGDKSAGPVDSAVGAGAPGGGQ